jgi:hypothetical protein
MSTQYSTGGETKEVATGAGNDGTTAGTGSAAGTGGGTESSNANLNWGSARSDYGEHAYGGSLDQQGLGGKGYDDFSEDRGRNTSNRGGTKGRSMRGGGGSGRVGYGLADTGNTGLTLLAGMAIGAALMYLLDPEQGGRRRSLLRDKFVALSNDAADVLGKTSRDLRNRAQGVIAETTRAVGLGAGEGSNASTGGSARGGTTATSAQEAGAAGSGRQ